MRTSRACETFRIARHMMWLAGLYLAMGLPTALAETVEALPDVPTEVFNIAGIAWMLFLAACIYCISWIAQKRSNDQQIFPPASLPKLKCRGIDIWIVLGVFLVAPAFVAIISGIRGMRGILIASNLGHLLSVGLLIFLIHWRGQNPLRALGLKFSGLAGQIGPGLATFLAFMPVLIGINIGWRMLLNWFVGPDAALARQDIVQRFTETPDSVVALQIAISAVIVAPIVEEVLFRGLLYGFIRRWIKPWLAMALIGLLFGVLHPPLAIFLPISIFGVFLCLVYEKTGNLLIPIGIHALFNLGSTLLMFSDRLAGVIG